MTLRESRSVTVVDRSRYFTDLMCTATPALVSGAVQAVAFNPIDRALYVRVQNRRRRFLDFRNFERPFQGFANAAVYRTIVGASYVFWQDSCRYWLNEFAPEFSKYPALSAVTIGLVAGCCNGLALNNLQAVKFTMWSADATVASPTFFGTVRRMYNIGGVSVFFRGIRITMLRDAVFGVVYETMRHSPYARNAAERVHTFANGHGPSKTDRDFLSFFINVISALFATIFSAPINYARSMVYGSPLCATPFSVGRLLRNLAVETKYVWKSGRSFRDTPIAEYNPQARGQQWKDAWRFLNARLNVGWGSLRVGLGMAVGQYVFSFVKEAMDA